MPNYAEAFRVQAASDLDAYEALTKTKLPTCHRLHYLQMWLEKLCKAYLWLPASAADDLRTRHNVVDKILPRMIAEHWRRIGFDQRPNFGAIRELCREIDLLHPQIDDNGRRPDNVEYPWIDSHGHATAPAAPGWKFALAARLNSPTGRLLLKGAIAMTRQPALFLRATAPGR
jgi:hypothetical protein